MGWGSKGEGKPAAGVCSSLFSFSWHHPTTTFLSLAFCLLTKATKPGKMADTPPNANAIKFRPWPRGSEERKEQQASGNRRRGG